MKVAPETDTPATVDVERQINAPVNSFRSGIEQDTVFFFPPKDERSAETDITRVLFSAAPMNKFNLRFKDCVLEQEYQDKNEVYYVITKKGGPEVLKVRESDDPIPGRDQVRIRVKATGVNFADILCRVGMYPDAPPPPSVIGYEISGVIDLLGPNVLESYMNKSVVALTNFKGYADTIILPVSAVHEKPEELSFVDAASVPLVYLTAWMTLVHTGGLRKGQSILIHNAGGGVGLAALDIAKHIGAITIGTASAKKHELLKQRGLDHAIDYRNQDYVAEVKKITNGKGVDLIIDPIGAAEWPKNYSILRSGGKLGIFGLSAFKETSKYFYPLQMMSIVGAIIRMPRWSALQLFTESKGVFGVNLGVMWEDPERLNEWMAEIIEGIKEGWIRPYVDAVYDFDHAGESHTYIEERKNFGKVVLVPTAQEANEWKAVNRKP
ncbi:hypothetical protein HDU76_002982 [Blyttiomyces sp. JEL0837]|nr:hypothetical protein HDU76_002982 [Blyttiomyces sp. JEL0837]